MVANWHICGGGSPWPTKQTEWSASTE